MALYRVTCDVHCSSGNEDDIVQELTNQLSGFYGCRHMPDSIEKIRDDEPEEDE